MKSNFCVQMCYSYIKDLLSFDSTPGPFKILVISIVTCIVIIASSFLTGILCDTYCPGKSGHNDTSPPLKVCNIEAADFSYIVCGLVGLMELFMLSIVCGFVGSMVILIASGCCECCAHIRTEFREKSKAIVLNNIIVESKIY